MGRTPYDLEKNWRRMIGRGSSAYALGNRGIIVSAASAIDIALWDIISKSFGTPLYSLLGGKFRAALNSNLRREILKILSKEPMTVIRVLNELKKKRIEIKYRETVYRDLEKLLDAGLVNKYYVKDKGLCYELKVKTSSH